MALIKINSSGTWQNTWGGVSVSCSSCDGECKGGCKTNCYYACKSYCDSSCRGACEGCSSACWSQNEYPMVYNGRHGSSSPNQSVGTTTKSYPYTKINSSGTFKVPTNLRLNVSGTWKTLSK